MTDNNLKSDFHGIWRIVPSMTLTEIIGQSGFDFQILDCEHGAYDYLTLEQDLRICHLQSSKAYVRVSGLDGVEVQRCLDLGADGIVFPQLSNYKDFKSAAAMMQYAPNGTRGFNPFVSAGGYGFESVHEKQLKCIAIVETLKAVEELDQILTIDNLDILYIGVYDLSAHLGRIGVMDAPELVSLVDTIIQKCVAASKSVSVMVNSQSSFEYYKNRGINVFVHTVDSFQLKTAFKSILTNIKSNT